MGPPSLTLQRAGPNSLLAEASLFSEVYHCDAVALHAAETLAVPRGTLRRHLTEDAAFAEAWAAYLAGEVQAARLRAEILSLRTVAARFDAWLAANDYASPARGTWKTLATEIGVSPPALYRELARRRQTFRGVVSR